MIEQRMFNVVCSICQKYSDRDLAHDAHGIWQLSGDCLRQLVVPFGCHPLACKLSKCLVDFYCDQFTSAHAG